MSGEQKRISETTPPEPKQSETTSAVAITPEGKTDSNFDIGFFTLEERRSIFEMDIPKKKQKGKKVVAGNSLGATNTATNQKGDYKTPRKPNRAVTPKKNRQSSNGKKNTINHNNNKNKNKNNNNKNHPKKKGNNWNNKFVKGGTDRRFFDVLGTLPEDVDADKVRAALNSKNNLPEKFKDACRDTKLELNEFRDFVVPKGAKCRYNYFKRVLPKAKRRGFLDWLQGQKGWIIVDKKKTPYLTYCRKLHEVYDEKVRALIKQFNKEDKKTKDALRLLYYKDPLTLNNEPKESSNQTIWKKVSETQSLDAGVGMIRPFLEVVRYFCIDPQEKWTSLPWLIPAITLEQSRIRIQRISLFVFDLMRNSDWGPDAPVHWAAHPARNGYPLTMVTAETMTEVVVGLANILSHLFLPKPTILKNLEDVDKMLKSPLWSNKKASPKSSNNKKVAKSKSNRSPRATSSNSVDDIVIDLTGLSIND